MVLLQFQKLRDLQFKMQHFFYYQFILLQLFETFLQFDCCINIYYYNIIQFI